MIVRVKRVWDAPLEKYKTVLDKFNAHYQDESLALVEFKAVNEIFEFVKEMKSDLYIDHFNNNILYIYDDYIE